jgi:small subunit ribosomal protein S16
MLTIRFNRTGKRNKAQFRIVLQEHTVAPGGRHVEVLGSWDPHMKKGVFQGEKIKEWITKGAQVSDSVWNLLIRQGIIEGKKRAKKIKKPAEVKTEEVKAETTGESKPEETQTQEAATEPVKIEEVKPGDITEAPTIAKGDVGGPTAELVGQKPKEEQKKE